MFWPLMTPAEGETVVQTAGEARFVVDRKVKPATFVGRIKITLPKESWSLAAGWPVLVTVLQIPWLFGKIRRQVKLGKPWAQHEIAAAVRADRADHEVA